MGVTVPCLAHFKPVNVSKTSQLLTVISQNLYMVILASQVTQTSNVLPKIHLQKISCLKFKIVRSQCFFELTEQQTWQRNKSTIYVNRGLCHFQKYHSHRNWTFISILAPGRSAKVEFFLQICPLLCIKIECIKGDTRSIHFVEFYFGIPRQHRSLINALKMLKKSFGYQQGFVQYPKMDQGVFFDDFGPFPPEIYDFEE